jgi:1-acyl-sn-glycerol-3-phosphate acyltransferase
VDTAGAQAEAEVELPDGSDDEYLPRREVPLTLVPPPTDTEPPREPFFADQSSRAEPEPSAPHPMGMFSLAKEIAVQALSSASVGKALGAAHGLVGAMRAGLGTSGSTSLDEYGRDAELVSELQPMLDFLYERYWRVSVQGVDQVPSGGAILVANHSGALPYDGLVASMVLMRERPDLREPRWLVEDQVFHAPMLGTLFNRLGAVRACPENAVRLLDEQRPVLVFPEGYQGMSKPFAQRYQLKRFGRGGFVKLALRTGAPIIPVAVVGAEETSPLLGRIPASFLGVPYLPLTGPVPLPAKWFLRFGEPISTEELGPEDADDLAEVQRVTERTRESIQGMLQALLRERRSVFAG